MTDYIKLISELKTENKELKEKIEALVRVNERLCNKISELEGKLYGTNNAV